MKGEILLNKTTWKFYLFIAISLVMLGIGLYALNLEFTEGKYITDLKNLNKGGVTWGIYIVFAIYFIGISFAGILTSLTIRLLKIEKYKPIIRISELIAFISIILGVILILADLGKPFRALTNLILYARPMSPFFYTFSVTFITLLLSSIILFYFSTRKDTFILSKNPSKLKLIYKLWSYNYSNKPEIVIKNEKAAWFFSLFILPIIFIAITFSGYVFGSQVSRPGWYSSLQGPFFIIISITSGIALLIIIISVIRKAFNAEKILNLEIFKGLSNISAIMVLIMFYFIASEVYTAFYMGSLHEYKVFKEIYFGSYSQLSWFMLISFIIAFLIILGMFILRNYKISLIVLSSILITLGVILKRYLFIIPSQTHGSFLPYPTGFYVPTVIEYLVIIGIIGLGLFMFGIIAKIFPIVEKSEKV